MGDRGAARGVGSCTRGRCESQRQHQQGRGRQPRAQHAHRDLQPRAPQFTDDRQHPGRQGQRGQHGAGQHQRQLAPLHAGGARGHARRQAQHGGQAQGHGRLQGPGQGHRGARQGTAQQQQPVAVELAAHGLQGQASGQRQAESEEGLAGPLDAARRQLPQQQAQRHQRQQQRRRDEGVRGAAQEPAHAGDGRVRQGRAAWRQHHQRHEPRHAGAAFHASARTRNHSPSAAMAPPPARTR
jgi:hypothetical protein